jgi:hypothetical protein
VDLTESYRQHFPVGVLDRYEMREVRDAAAVLANTSTEELGERLGRDPFRTSTTTNLDKLLPRMARGDGGGCPILAIAITARCLVEE